MLGMALFLLLDAHCTPCNVTFYTYNYGYQINENPDHCSLKIPLLLRFLIGHILKINPTVWEFGGSLMGFHTYSPPRGKRKSCQLDLMYP